MYPDIYVQGNHSIVTQVYTTYIYIRALIKSNQLS